MNEDTIEQKTESDWSKRELGALWRVDGKNMSFYSGSIKVGEQTLKVVCFPNKNKEPNSNQPDIRVYESKEKTL